MRKILFTLMTAVLVIGLAGAGAFAYFSDTETSVGNSFTAGTLDLGLAHSGGTNPTGSVVDTYGTPPNWAPGNTLDRNLYIYNAGSIDAARLTVSFDYVLTEGTPATVAAPKSTSLENMIIATTVTYDGGTVADLQGKSLKQLKEAGETTIGSLDATTEKVLRIVWTFSTNADNGCQGDSSGITVNVAAYQIA